MLYNNVTPLTLTTTEQFNIIYTIVISDKIGEHLEARIKIESNSEIEHIIWCIWNPKHIVRKKCFCLLEAPVGCALDCPV